MEKNQTIELKIDDMLDDGRAFGRFESCAVFVSGGCRLPSGGRAAGAVPGDMVRAKVIKAKKSSAEAELQEITEPSPDRITAECTYCGRCGGCAMQELTYEAQKRLKRDQVRAKLERLGGLSDPEVNEIIGGTAGAELLEKYAPVIQTIKDGQELAEILKAKAKQRGELEIETSELRFVLDERGVCVGVSERERGEAEELIEQFMIMANRAAALYAKSALIPFVYRVHEAPEADRLESLAELAAACGFQTRRLREGVHQTDLSELIEKAKGTKYSRLISTQVLRTMAKARYAPEPLGHFGLSLSDYCHFTSPIRRYPDTSIHRILTDLVKGVSIDRIQEHYSEFARESSRMSSDRELRAMRAEREAEKCYAAEYMTSHIGEVHPGIISGVTNKGLFVALETGIEGFVNLVDDEHAFFEFDGTASTTDRRTGRSYSIGDSVTVKVINASVPTGTVDFELFGEVS